MLGIFYATSTCYTHMIAKAISNSLISKHQLHDIRQCGLKDMSKYSYIICGIPTWDFGELQEDWDKHWDSIIQLDLTGSKVAVFGLGDQTGYADWFQDAMGYLYFSLEAQGAEMYGQTKTEGYVFCKSQAVLPGGNFVGLSLDEQNQSELTENRLQDWLESLADSFKLQIR